MKKKRRSIFITLFVMLCMSISANAQNEYATYRIRIVRTLKYNNSVGYNWYSTYTVNGQRINDGYEIKRKPNGNDSMTINVAIVEDDKYPDVGKETFTINIQSGKRVTKEIRVVENKGRYAGHSAVWTVTVYAERVK